MYVSTMHIRILNGASRPLSGAECSLRREQLYAVKPSVFHLGVRFCFFVWKQSPPGEIRALGGDLLFSTTLQQ